MCESYDIAVLGGGVAGIAAALAGARQNKRVVLIEKQCILGGLATSGLITIYLPLCDGKGHQASFGIAEELLRLSIELGCQRKYPGPWLEGGSLEQKAETRFEAQFNPYYFALLLEKTLIENHITILYDANLSGVKVNNGKAEAVLIDTLEGKTEIRAKAFVDATGDAKLCYLANEKTRKFEHGNTLAGWYYYVKDGKLMLKKHGTVEAKSSIKMERSVEKQLRTERYIGGVYDAENKFLLDSHAETLNDILREKEKDESFEVVSMPMMPEIRMSRCVEGKGKFILDDGCPQSTDSIGVIADWRRRGYIYEVPFSSLRTEGLKNVFVAGRCINVDDEMWDVTRAIPACAVTGEASGIAAAIYSEEEAVEIQNLQKRLRDKGQCLFIQEILDMD